MERTPEEISLLDVIEAIDGPLVSNMPVSLGLPRESKAKLEAALKEVNTIARRELEAVKLAHLLPGPSK